MLIIDQQYSYVNWEVVFLVRGVLHLHGAVRGLDWLVHRFFLAVQFLDLDVQELRSGLSSVLANVWSSAGTRVLVLMVQIPMYLAFQLEYRLQFWFLLDLVDWYLGISANSRDHWVMAFRPLDVESRSIWLKRGCSLWLLQVVLTCL